MYLPRLQHIAKPFTLQVYHAVVIHLSSISFTYQTPIEYRIKSFAMDKDADKYPLHTAAREGRGKYSSHRE